MKMLFLWLCLAPAFADELDLDKEVQQLQQQATQAQQQLQQIQKMAPLNTQQLGAVQQKMTALMSDDSFTKALNQVWANPNRNKMFLIQAAFFILMLIIKAILKARSNFWLSRFLIGVVCTLVSWAGLSYFIPVFLLGEPYRMIVAALWKTFKP